MVNSRKCPHENIVDCPLYVAAHEVGGNSCIDAWTGPDGNCAVVRGAQDYATALAALRSAKPRLVAEVEFGAAVRASREQRDRNMRMAGVH